MAARAMTEVPAAAETPWANLYAQRTSGMTSSVIRELLKLTADPGIISFAGGLPAPEVFPVAEVAAAASRVLAIHGAEALQYSTTEGHLPLRQMLVRHMGRYGIEVGPDNVLVTSGAQQALDLVGKLFLDPGDRVLVEAPTFVGAIQAFRSYQAQYLTVPVDEDGLRVDLLEDALRARPEVPVRPAELPEPGRRHPVPRAPPPAGGARQPLPYPDRRGRPLRPAPLRGRAPAPAGEDRRGAPRLRPRRARASRRSPLPRHAQQDAGAGTATGVDRCARGRHPRAWSR